ncbi:MULTISPECIES: molybdate ABC transporter permease subunit [Heyndrickxia]|uniref:Molybdenum transport system permease n=1 Tax=Heyndrickxia sporothermodurans TaxID=46224 RepID=A0AB37HIH4_9BACI|nr:molybdate ABC transporter permease subunit [Heyndrickxia sporothermodurans]MBL5771056.1 molybdate ABC transporter permease subunit [Heyndrickxia sporothermodurans]MBL5774725.1 molybdate ABC transporter permease subunit [Heyndrickxia sporothermodurans]MBL5778183.1 molybdate ABC transporter permease subunit [Heyndrickxia sporothermodurans]MBL5785430.1 molybdate ABC transporter permease subunit [Heyndrickxia sporothermodurans]MBL5788917.1 molybdate ABC transporter permease subunit [Heyndrickxi
MATNFWSPVILSIEIAIFSCIVVFIFGIIFGKFMANRWFKGKAIIETIFLLPLVLPPTVVGFLLIIFFGRNSLIGQLIESIFQQPIMFTWWAAVLAAIVVAFPLMYQSCKTGFESVDKDIENAARVDGAGEFNIFLFISLPLSLKVIISGAIMSFARALGEFGATLMFAGNIPGKTQTTPTAIYIAIDSGNMEMAWLWVACMIGISFLMLFGIQLMRK